MTDKSVRDATEEWVRHSITKEFTPIDINDVYKAFAAGAQWQAQQAQVPEGWRAGNSVTVNQEEYPGLGAFFTQIWDMDKDEVVARVYGDSHSQIRERIDAMLTASPAPDHIKDTLGMVKHTPDAGKMVEALRGLIEIISGSRGVDGYHLNGDIAEWDEFEEVGFAIDVYEAHTQQEGVER